MVDPWSRNYVINVEDPLMNFRQQLCKTNFHSTYEILRDKEDRFASTNYYYVRKRSQSADDHRRFFAKFSKFADEFDECDRENRLRLEIKGLLIVDRLYHMDNSKIVPLLAVFYEPFAFDDEEKEKYLISIFEGQEGDLSAKSGLLTEEAASNIYVKVTSDLIWLHSMQLIHGDIKPHNILLSRQNIPYIIDFSSLVLEENGERLDQYSLAYRSPEIADFETQTITRATDWWSLGISIVESVIGEKYSFMNNPFFGLTSNYFNFNAMRERSREFLDLICRLLEYDARMRKEFTKDITVHPWFGSSDHRKEFDAEIAKIQGIENRSGSPVYTIYRRKSERIKAPGTVGQPTGIHSPKVIWGEDIGTVKEWIKTKVLNDVYPELVIAPVRNSKEAYDIKEENATEVPDDAPVNEIKTIVIFY